MQKRRCTIHDKYQRVPRRWALVWIVLLLTLPAACAKEAPVIGSAQMARVVTATPVPRPTLSPTSPPAVRTATAAPPPTATASPPAAYPVPQILPTPASAAASTAYPGVAAGEVAVPRYGYRIVDMFPHDRLAYTQGLLVEDSPDILLESTGLRGESSLRRVVLETGEVLQRLALPEQYFAEGIAVVGDRIVQLTWQSQQGFVYDRQSFDLQEQFSYPHEGWGITFDGERLIVSDGTDVLRFWDPQTLQEIGRVRVYDESSPVFLLNELEIVEGEIWANVYQTDLIARIDPFSGEVTGWVDLSGLLAPEYRDGTENVLNGIAYDAANGRLFVTGKRWPLLFEIEIVELD